MKNLLPILKVGQTIAHKVMTKQNVNMCLNTTLVTHGLAIVRGFAVDNNLSKKELTDALKFLTSKCNFSVKEAAEITNMSVSYAYKLLKR